jgi:hypothetical protein
VDRERPETDGLFGRVDAEVDPLPLHVCPLCSFIELYSNPVPLLAEVLNGLRQEFATKGKTTKFEALNVFLDPVDSGTPPSYKEVAKRLQVSAGAIKTLIHRLRKWYNALLHEEVGRTVSDAAEVEEEIHALCPGIIASEGWLGP